MKDDEIIYIWDQKPRPWIKSGGVWTYHAPSMDTWLDKLKILYEALTETVIEQGKIISQFKEKNE